MSTSAALKALRKICKNCGREITWRKKWENTWDTIIYCSATCRRPLGALDRAFETCIIDLLRIRRNIAVATHKAGGSAHNSASITCEEAEAMVLDNWKSNPLAQRDDIGGGSDEAQGEGSSSEEEIVPVLNRKERRKAEADAAALLISSSSVEILESNTTFNKNSTHTKPSYMPNSIPKLDSLSLSDTSTSITPTKSTSGDTSSITPTRSAPRDTRERARKAARRLVIVGAIEIWQAGKIVDPSFAKGVMQLRGGINFDLIAKERENEGTKSWEPEDNWNGPGALYVSGKLGKKRKGNQKNGRANE